VAGPLVSKSILGPVGLPCDGWVVFRRSIAAAVPLLIWLSRYESGEPLPSGCSLSHFRAEDPFSMLVL
jgi:hypothetical protein